MIDITGIIAVKGECEAEGLSRDCMAFEALFASRRGLPYLVKIGGCEAKADMRFLIRMGIDHIVAPMIESAFAMRKYMAMLPEGVFHHIGVTIETIDAVNRIEALLDAGSRLDGVTIGRTDLTDSYGGSSVDSAQTIDMTKQVARAARARGLGVTMGGSISRRTIDLLRGDAELVNLIDAIETRKCVLPVSEALRPGALDRAFGVETALLAQQQQAFGGIVEAVEARLGQIRGRL
jgi:4-hydroxy-2-oxoheptanedioate aldolase